MAIINLYLIASMLAVMWLGCTRFRIPNWLVGGLLAAYPLALFVAVHPVDWQGSLQAMAVVFVAGYLVFALRLMGGGDVKLITALALWVGLRHLVEFIFLFAILGGVFSMLLWFLRKLLVSAPVAAKLGSRSLPRILREGEPVAYGFAIALGFMVLMAQGKLAIM